MHESSGPARSSHACVRSSLAVQLGLEEMADTRRHWHLQSCSAYTGAGLADGVEWLVKDIASRIYMYD